MQQSEVHELTDFLANAPGARRCPEDPAQPQQAARPSAGSPEAVQTYLTEARRRLPKPQPCIEPGRAITGKEAFLELRSGSGDQSFTFANPFGEGDVRVDASPTYEIDWGDGTTTETSSRGGPWPDGDVRHVYDELGHYDVVVTARWAARWTAGSGESGSLDDLTTEGRIDRFPVTEVQAVRQR